MRPKLFGLALATLVAVFGVAVVAGADTIVRSFNTNSNIPPGWVVALSSSDNTTVVLATAKNPSKIYGVVIDPSAAPLTIQKQAQQVFVANSGNYPVLVSTANGPVKSGDYLTISTTDGIATKASDNDQFVIGRALQNFSGGPSAIIYTNDGTALGRISMQIMAGKNPLLKDVAGIPQPLKRVSDSIAGRSVPPLRLYTALAVFVVAALISVVLLWGGIRSGMIAIGRNPLSRHSIIRGLAEVITAALAVLIIGLIGVYLLLKI